MPQTTEGIVDLFRLPELLSREKLIDLWTLAIKISAIDCKYYSCPQIRWVPRVGDFWCLTKDGGNLEELLELNSHTVVYHILYDSGWNRLEVPEVKELLTEDFMGEFMEHRVPVPFWAWEAKRVLPVQSPPEGVPVLMRFE